MALISTHLQKILPEKANGYESLSSLGILLQKEEGENPYEGHFRGGKALIDSFLDTLNQASSTKIADEPDSS